MRIVGGTLGGRRFNPPANIPARPTTDVAKEALFNMLSNNIDFEGLSTLDIFGGTGSITYELASRGATNLTIVERDPTSVTFVKKTATDLGIENRLQIVRGDVFRFLRQCTGQFDFIFADPPYALPNMDELPLLVFEKKLLVPGGTFVLEHAPRNDYQTHTNFQRIKKYGTTVFTFFHQPAE